MLVEVLPVLAVKLCPGVPSDSVAPTGMPLTVTAERVLLSPLSPFAVTARLSAIGWPCWPETGLVVTVGALGSTVTVSAAGVLAVLRLSVTTTLSAALASVAAVSVSAL